MREVFPSDSSEIPTTASDLTYIQQSALDCAACFQDRGDTVSALDIAQCHAEIGVDSARHAFRVLDARGLVTNTTPERRKNLYAPTDTGLEMARQPAECHIADQNKSLAPSVEKTLGCVSCLASRDIPITRTRIATCPQSPDSLNTVTKALRTLEAQGYTTANEPRNSGIYTITQRGIEDATPTSEQCPNAESFEVSTELSATQQLVLDCLRCQVAKGIVPNRQRVALCTDLDGQSVRRAAKFIANQGIISIHNEKEKPGLRGFGRMQSYTPKDIRTFSAKHNPDCNTSDKELALIHERLSAIRKRLMQCLVCIEDKIADGSPIPGTSTQLLMRCTGYPHTTVAQFLHALVAEGHYQEPLIGFSGSEHGQVFYRPTPKGSALIAHQKDTTESTACNAGIDALEKVPIHTRNAVIRCVGCLWTQCAASSVPPAAKAQTIAQCLDVNQSHITAFVLPRLAAEGYLEIQRSPGSANLYTPSSELRIPLGYPDSCNMNVFTDFDASPHFIPLQDIAIAANPTLKAELDDFEAFVAATATIEGAGNIEYNLIDRLVTQYPLLTAQEESYLGMIIQKHPDPKVVDNAIHRFVASNVRLAVWMARKRSFEAEITSYEDVTQAALTGVYLAAREFDPNLGYKFSTFCYYRMNAEIRNMTRAASEVSLETFSAMRKLVSNSKAYYKVHGRNPSTAEIAVMLGRSVRSVQSLLSAHAQITAKRASLNANTIEDGMELSELVGVNDEDLDAVHTNTLFDSVQKHLSPLRKAILQHVILGQMSLVDFAQKYELPEHTVRKTRNTINSILRHPYFGIGAALHAGQYDWQYDAQCAAENRPDLALQPEPSRARNVCEDCPVKSECHNLGLTSNPTTGIWGGVHANDLVAT